VSIPYIKREQSLLWQAATISSQIASWSTSHPLFLSLFPFFFLLLLSFFIIGQESSFFAFASFLLGYSEPSSMRLLEVVGPSILSLGPSLSLSLFLSEG